ncbi:MAG: phosphorelay protein, partial [Alphaproteobacteria bacterium]|nr:phosphorelay protein [Alphaproteobacteria bacterium]
MADSEKPQIITPPDTLKLKVAVGGSNAVDANALERAEQVIANMADSYLDWVEE